MDVNNLMWVIRYKVYHGLSKKRSSTIPCRSATAFRGRARTSGQLPLRGLSTVVGRAFPGIPDLNVLLGDLRRACRSSKSSRSGA